MPAVLRGANAQMLTKPMISSDVNVILGFVW